MARIEDNTVSAKGQLRVDERVFYENYKGQGIRVLFVGNSITLHGLATDIGWMGDNYGMAASARENDYVHLIMKQVQQADPDAAFCICQAADWERNWKAPLSVMPLFDAAKDFNTDIIIMRIVENCIRDDFDPDLFRTEYKNFINYFNPEGNAKVVLTTSFWKHIADSEIIEAGKELNLPVVDLNDLGEQDCMMAIGQYEHSGISYHPCDRGMAEIASRIMKIVEEWL